MVQDFDISYCPNCGAKGYERKTKTPEWRCRKCGVEWDENNTPIYPPGIYPARLSCPKCGKVYATGPEFSADTCQGHRRKPGDAYAGGFSFGQTADEGLYVLAIFGAWAFIVLIIVIIIVSIAK
jgi:hypothetical protein